MNSRYVGMKTGIYVGHNMFTHSHLRGPLSIVDVGNAQQIFNAVVQQSTLAIPRLKAVNVAIYSAFNVDLNSKLMQHKQVSTWAVRAIICAVNQGIYAQFKRQSTACLITANGQQFKGS